MIIIIEGKQYQGEALIRENKLYVTIEEDISTAFAWNKEMTITADGIEYTALSINSLVQNVNLLRIEWNIDSEIAVLERQLEKAQEDLSEARDALSVLNGEIDNIRQAIINLGTGVPTLSKLMAFLNAVKEAIHYD